MRHAIRTLIVLIACSFAGSVAIGDVGGAGQTAKRKPVISVTGSAVGLYPGGSVPLDVRVRNRGSRPLVVTRIRVRAGSDRACSGSNLAVQIPKRARNRLRLR